MQIRPVVPADLSGLDEIDGTIVSTEYLHLDRTGEGTDVSWKLAERPLREKRTLPNRLGDERQFLVKQIATGADEGFVLVAEHDGVPVALLVAQAEPAYGTIRVHDVRVDFDQRRLGLATAMMFQVIAQAREQGLRAVTADSMTDNVPAARFLLKCGFDLAGLDARRFTNHDLVKESVALHWYAALDQPIQRLRNAMADDRVKPPDDDGNGNGHSPVAVKPAPAHTPPPAHPAPPSIDVPDVPEIEGSDEEVAHRIEEIPADEGAAVLESLSPEKAADVAEYLDPDTAGRILTEMTPEAAGAVVSDMEAAEASMVLAAMDPDDAVDVLEHVNEKLHDEIVREMDPEDAEDVLALEKYPPDSAGGIMTSEVTALYEFLPVEDAIAQLRQLNEELEQMFYVYVIDRRGHLVGVLSMRDLILAKPATLLRDIMRPNVTSVPATMDQEHVAREMRRLGYLAMPVVDDKHRLVGLITFDDVADVLEEEATEDVQRMFGAGAEERLNSTWLFSFRKRVVWLLVNLVTAFMAAMVVGFFEDMISKFAVLAFYMPIIAGMGGNASAQAMAVAVRGLALGKVDRRLLWRVMYRQLFVGFATGIVIGLMTATVAWVFHNDPHGPGPKLGLVVALALIINHTLACVTGAGIPFIMRTFGFDPAQSSTIFATTITDVVGFFALLGLAAVMLR